jgi:hypothetical protein
MQRRSADADELVSVEDRNVIYTKCGVLVNASYKESEWLKPEECLLVEAVDAINQAAND